MMLALNIDSSKALVEDDCRQCHNENLSKVHHKLLPYYSCTDCHKDDNQSVVKLEDCIICHPVPEKIDHGKNISCADCHLEGGNYSDLDWNGPVLNKTGFFNSSHSNITGDFNASNYSQLSKVCWGCHVNYTNQLTNQSHSKTASQLPQCEDCHYNDIPLNMDHLIKNPIQIPEHRPGGEDILTADLTNCSLCHNNSLSIDVPTERVKYSEARNYVNHYLTTNHLMTPANNTSECMWCHINNSDNISWGKPFNPMKLDPINHTNFNITNSIRCYLCHVFNNSVLAEFTFHNITMTSGAGKDCLTCHDVNGWNEIVREKFRINGDVMNHSEAVHYDLNRGAAVTVHQNNARCWACHGEKDGTEANQPRRHPSSVWSGTPKNCSAMDCHNVYQSVFNEPMVYEHFKNTDEIDENISTAVDCPVCHLNSVVNYEDNIIPSDTSLVSHYGSTDDLINTTSCIYCHLDEDNALKWGNAPDPTDNISTLSDEEWEKTLYLGDRWHLSNRYFLVFEDLTAEGDRAHLRLYQGESIIEDIVLYEDHDYTYEDEFIDSDNKQVDAIVFELNLTSVFSGNNRTKLIQVKATMWKRLHPEDKDPACWACHMDDHVIKKKRYYVLDEDEDRIYYIEKLLDFTEADAQDKEILCPESLVIKEGYNQTLHLNGNFMLSVDEIDTDGKQARLTLIKNGDQVEEYICKEGQFIEYKEDLSYEDHYIDDVVIVKARLDSVFNGINYDAVILTDVAVISDLMALEVDEIIGGFNTSHLHINDNFSIGGYPDTFHVPLLNEGLDGGSDCVYCHEISNGFNISAVSAVSTLLGGHSRLNINATSSNKLNSDIDKACWACHGDRDDLNRHPGDYLYPRQCEDCHVALEEPTFNAVDISDEAHGQVEDCSRCHGADYPGLHVINEFKPLTPYIADMVTVQKAQHPGQPVKVTFTTTAGWNMKVKAIEYFLDDEGLPGTGTSLLPVDGIFDEQIEEAALIINTTGLEYGNHTIYARSMERDDKWGAMNTIVFSITNQSVDKTPVHLGLGHWWLVSILILLIGVVLLLKGRPKAGVMSILIATGIILSVAAGGSGYIFQSPGSTQTPITQSSSILNEAGGHTKECTFCHGEYGSKPDCSQCHELVHGPSLQDCRDCHDEHDPLNFTGRFVYENNCYYCHSQQLDEFLNSPGRHFDLKCVYCHLNHRQIEACINCHAPHSPNMTYEDCLSCHPAHRPQEIDYPEKSPDRYCASCHSEVNSALVSGSTKHSTLTCTYCHEVHEMIPKCSDCHTPHIDNLTNEDCMGCHPAHDPMDMQFPANTWRDTCAACHEEVSEELSGSNTIHDELDCIYCHPEHRYVPNCESCHGLPHEKIHDDYPECIQCHIFSHDVKNIIFTKSP